VSKTFDRYASLLFLMIGAGFMVGSREISASAYGSKVGPDIFPFWLGLILALLSVRLFYETFRYKAEKKEKMQLDYKRFLIILIASILYCFFLEDIGYVLGTFIFLLIGFQTMEKGKWMTSVLVSALFSFGVYYLFVEILDGSLPGFPAWLGL
jgi:putative tricarboxylic transport membrane protein